MMTYNATETTMFLNYWDVQHLIVKNNAYGMLGALSLWTLLFLKRMSRNKNPKTAALEVAFVHACVCGLGSLYVLFTDDDLSEEMYAFSPKAHFFITLSFGYFCWDLFVSINYNWGMAYIIHALAALWVYMQCMFPYVQYGACIGLTWEISSIFLNAKALSQKDSFIYRICKTLFFATFTVIRMFLGLPISFKLWTDWWQLYSGGLYHNREVVIGSYIAQGSLVLMNIYWFVSMLSTFFCKRQKKMKLE